MHVTYIQIQSHKHLNIHNLRHTHKLHTHYKNRSFFQIFSQVQNITNEQFLYSSNVIYKEVYYKYVCT